MREQLAVWDNCEDAVISHHRTFTAAQRQMQRIDPMKTGHYSIVRWKLSVLKYGKRARIYYSLLTSKPIAVVTK